EANGAEVLGRYRGQPFDGAPAVTMKRVGSGKVFYVGTSLDDAGQDSLMSKVLSEAKVSPGVLSPDNVEIVRRVHEGTDHWFILNHGPAPQEVTIPASGIDLLTGKALAGNITVNGLDALVVRSQSSP
ncbi:MAG: beta-galactosidase, partial [Chloroflexota bacterium]